MAYSKQTWANSPATSSPISAARLGHIEDGIISDDRGTFASRPGSGVNAGDLYECTDNGIAYRWSGSAWEVARNTPSMGLFTPPPSASWSAFNSGSVTAEKDSRLHSLASGSGDSWKGELRTLSPTSNYTATFYFDWSMRPINYVQGGLILKAAAAAPFITFGPLYNAAFSLNSIKWTSTTASSAVYTSVTIGNLVGAAIPNWLRVRDDNTNRYYEYSYNGADWTLLNSTTRTDYITPDQIGWGISANNTGGSYTAITRLRSFVIS